VSVLHVVVLQSSGRGPAVDVDVLEEFVPGSIRTNAMKGKGIPHAWSVRKAHHDRYEVCSA
jgi:hypothetical protein